MKRTVSLLVVLAVVLALLPAAVVQATGTPDATGTLEATTTHTMVSPPEFEDGRWMLAWQGEITGDINGTIKWWLDTENWTAWDNIVNDLPPEPVSHYISKGRVYDSDSGELLLETLGRGETTMTTTTWWGNAIVTFADPALFPGWEGKGVREAGEFDVTTTPWTGTSTFKLTTEPIVTGAVLVDAATDEDIGPLWPGTVIDLGTTPSFNVRVETAPATVGSVGFAVTDSGGDPVHFRPDRSPVENFTPYAMAGDWPMGDFVAAPLGMGSYIVTATPYTHGSRTGLAGPAYEVPFTVVQPFEATWTGEVMAIDTDPDAIAARCTGPAWAVVSFSGSGETALLGEFTGVAEHCSYVGPLPDGTTGPDGTYGEGMFTITAANGDLLQGTYTKGVTATPPPVAEFTDSFTFTGGTGRFVNASGGGTESGSADFTGGFVPGAPFTVTMEGGIAY